MNEPEQDIPVLTDIIDTTSPVRQSVAQSSVALEQLEQALSDRLISGLSLQLPVLVEAALREHLPQALGAKLQAELLNTLTNALPIAAQAATSELSSKVAYELGASLEMRLQEEVRSAVAQEIAALKAHNL